MNSLNHLFINNIYNSAEVLLAFSSVKIVRKGEGRMCVCGLQSPLVFAQRKNLLDVALAVLGDNLNDDTVADVDVSLAGRDKGILDEVLHKVHRQIELLERLLLISTADDAVEEGLNERGTAADAVVRQALKATHWVVIVDDTGAVLVEAGDQVADVVGEEAFPVEHRRNELCHGVSAHVFAMIVVVELEVQVGFG